jgi:hypothetical protein
LDKVSIWSDILLFSGPLLFLYSFNFIQFYHYCIREQNQRKDYPLVPSMVRLILIYVYLAFIFYLTKMAYDRFFLITKNSFLFIPIAFIPLAAILYFTLSFYRRYLSRSTKHTVTVRPIDKKVKVITFSDNFRKLLLREQANSTYPIDPEMVLHFKKKYLWQYILSWFSITLCIYLLIIY